jgi:hypothetical protein
MQLADAYRLLGLSPGATEPEVRQAHDQHQWHWHGDRHNQNPQASQYAYARRAEVAVALDTIHRAGFPDVNGAPRMGAYGSAPYAPAPPAPSAYPPPPAPQAAYQPQQGVEVAWQPHHGPLPMPVAPPPMPVDAVRAHKRSQGTTQMLVGGGLVILGIVITTATHDAAVSNGGGTYLVAYGPIIFGVIRFFQGLFNVTTA